MLSLLRAARHVAGMYYYSLEVRRPEHWHYYCLTSSQAAMIVCRLAECNLRPAVNRPAMGCIRLTADC
jgi:hypothetical protein